MGTPTHLLGSSLPSHHMMPMVHPLPLVAPHLMLVQSASNPVLNHMVMSGLYQHNPLVAMQSDGLLSHQNWDSTPVLVGQQASVASFGPKKPLRRLQPQQQHQQQQQLQQQQQQQQQSPKQDEQECPAKQEQHEPAKEEEEPLGPEEDQQPATGDEQQPHMDPAKQEPQQLSAKEEEQGQQRHVFMPNRGNKLTPLDQQHPPKMEPKTPVQDSSTGGPQQWSTTDKASFIQLSQSNLWACKKGYGSGTVRSIHPISNSGQGHNSTLSLVFFEFSLLLLTLAANAQPISPN